MKMGVIPYGKEIETSQEPCRVRLPKSMRKSKLLRAMLNNPLGRDVVANALTAGASAAAAVLVENREEIAQAGKKGLKRAFRLPHWLPRAAPARPTP